MGALIGVTALALVSGCAPASGPASSAPPASTLSGQAATPQQTPPATPPTTPPATVAPSGAATAAPETLAPMRAGAIQPPAHGTLLGIFRPPAPYQLGALDTYTAISPKRPAIVMWYQQWGPGTPNRFDPAMSAGVYARGAVPMISWEPWDPGGKPHNLTNPADAPEWSLSTIVAGKHDAYIRSWASAIKKLGGPVFLRPMHEMNGNWYPWGGTVNGNTPKLYIAAWRHIHAIFDAAGVTNVTWVWSVNLNSKPNRYDNVYSVYYPGDAYVDWVGVSGFNAGTNQVTGARNLFDQLFDTPLAYLSTLHKPIVICESASVEQDADKPAWITDAYAKLSTEHTEVKGFVYYDALETGVKHGRQDFRITSSPASAAAYRAAVAPSYFIAAPLDAVVRWKAGLSAGDRKKLASYKPIY